MYSLTCSRIIMNSHCKRIRRIRIKSSSKTTLAAQTIFDFVDNGKLIDIPIENIRNFSVIAHVDHGI